MECVQAEATARIWDCMLLEGHEVLFRYAYAVLRINQAYLTDGDARR